MDDSFSDNTSLLYNGDRVNALGKILKIDFHLIGMIAFFRMDHASLHVENLHRLDILASDMEFVDNGIRIDCHLILLFVHPIIIGDGPTCRDT